MSRSHLRVGGFLMVTLGAALWGTDAVFRRGLALELPAPTLVFLEHMVLLIVVAPMLIRRRVELTQLNWADWVSAVVVGAGSSVLATVLFTAAFRYGDPTTPLLLQKAQPLVAVTAAHLILGEQLLPRYTFFLLSGLAGAYLVAFPDPTAVTVSALTPALLALGAATLWGIGTVLGRRLSTPLSFQTLTALRFAIGLPMAGILVAALPEATGALRHLSASDLQAILALAMIPGLAALILYYHGLQTTPAAVATLGELSFPLTAVTINYLAFGTTLSPTQLGGALLLTATITTISWLSQHGTQTIGVTPTTTPVTSP